MSEAKSVLGIVGSPNPEGRTNQLVRAALEGAAQAGADTELLHLSRHPVEACKDCLPWVCHQNLKCTYEDEHFDILREKILNCGALVMGTPVYWWDASGLIKYLILKMFRVYAKSGPLAGMPALGISIAGGTGNGLISGLRQVYHFFQVMQMRALAPLPVTRFNFDEALAQARLRGSELAEAAPNRRPFESLEERLMHYDSLPYLNQSREQERRLLASLVCGALPEDSRPCHYLAEAQILSSQGDRQGAMQAVSRAYGEGLELFENISH